MSPHAQTAEHAEPPPQAVSPQHVKPLRVIQVGAGAMGQLWLATIAASPDVELVGLVDLDLTAARSAAEAAGCPGVEVAGSLEELAETTDAQAVVNVTVPSAHSTVNLAALRRGLPVLCEKPLAESVSECLSMAAAAEVTQTLLAVSQSRRYGRNLEAFRVQIDQLGTLGLLSCEFFKAPHFGGFREQMAEPLLVDMPIHQFDLARLLIGAEPVSVYCESSNPRWSWFRGNAAAFAVFEFESGVRFVFDGSWCSPGVETSWNGRWRASASEGTAIWDGDSAPVAERATGIRVEPSVGEEPEQIAGSLAEFVAAVRHGTTPSGEVHGNILSVAMVEAAVRSAATGRRVTTVEIIDDAYGQALDRESDSDIGATFRSWSSVHDVLV